MQHPPGASSPVTLSGADPDLRAGDQDRQEAADRLRKAVDEGRLTLDEYDERLAAAYLAKTYRELAALTADLPPPADASGSRRTTVGPVRAAQRGGEVDRRRWSPWRPWLTVSAVTTGIWGVSVVSSGEVSYFWPVWVVVPWGIVLGVQTLAGGHWRCGRGC